MIRQLRRLGYRIEPPNPQPFVDPSLTLRSHWSQIGEVLTGLLIGFIAGEVYTGQSIRMNDGDIVLAF
jgi:hypothetical protein